ncbi:DUF6470 family protein [Piscibacillus salipiscarius]|uniref:DUF6470 family protein n=1 Tax=Piscibacillus salipiscarius TaxID=299480 RepID=A0ABW5QB49_9BACI|nr:DUF6470 family protein [Piscibacillus salipiscarius]
MNLPKLNITQQSAMIGMNKTPGQLSIRQPHAELHISQPPANLKIHRRPSKLTIDQSQAFKELNMVGPVEAIKEAAQEGKQKAAEGVSRIANEGDQLMRIEKGANGVIAQISENNSFNDYQPIQMKWIPSNFAVKFDYDPGDVQIEANANKPIINATPHQPEIDYQQSKLDIYLQQDNQIDINFDNLTYKNLGFEMEI